MAKRKKVSKTKKIYWTFHPRVFTSLGAELVTNDFVALIELVKNSYDAFARSVDIRFQNDEKTGEQIIEVQDTGQGMSRADIIDSWLKVGTSFKADHKTIKSGKDVRRVTGEKGLGRLSAARLGGTLTMFTKRVNAPCYRVDIDWDAISKANSIDKCGVLIQAVKPPKGLEKKGTLLRMQRLKKKWDFEAKSDLSELQTGLARFIPPFKSKKDFNINLTLPGQESQPVEITPPKILSQPPYVAKGSVDDKGEANIIYEYKGYDKESGRRISGFLKLAEDDSRLTDNKTSTRDDKLTECGPFDFEFRIWDLDKDSLFELDKRFDLREKVTNIRRLITDSPFSGISLYRDGILVLPKEIRLDKQVGAAEKDWLGLNLRRISRIGKRLSANQIVGYADISADINAALRDTADRERLVDNEASREFRKFLFRIVAFAEHEREKDGAEPYHKEPPLKELFAMLKAPVLPKKLEEIEARKGGWDEIRQVVDEHTKELDTAVDEIEQRFYYYSRLANIGSLAMLLEHEVGNKVAVISELVSQLRENLEKIKSLGNLERRLELAENAIRSLQRLADIFSPLANRNFGTRRRNSGLEEIISQTAEWHEKEIKHMQVKLHIVSDGQTVVAVDPGELVPIIDNLMTNSLYWLKKVSQEKREILIKIAPSITASRIDVRFHDSGPGIEDGLEEKIFWPGVTRKEDGIGMGLTVASELVAQYNGKMYLIKPGDLGGASFGFDLPLARAH